MISVRRLLPLPMIFGLLFAPLLTTSDTAYACSCAPTTVEERVERSDVVAIGTVISLYEDETTDGSGGGFIVDMDGVVSVDTYYKGSGPPEIAVDDPAHGGTCGIIGPDTVGLDAVLFLNLSDGAYVTGLCHGSRFFDEGSSPALIIADIEAVTGPGQPPEGPPPQASPPPEEPAEHTESTPWAIVLPLAFAIPLAVLFVPAFLHRRRGGH